MTEEDIGVTSKSPSARTKSAAGGREIRLIVQDVSASVWREGTRTREETRTRSSPCIGAWTGVTSSLTRRHPLLGYLPDQRSDELHPTRLNELGGDDERDQPIT